MLKEKMNIKQNLEYLSQKKKKKDFGITRSFLIFQSFYGSGQYIS